MRIEVRNEPLKKYVLELIASDVVHIKYGNEKRQIPHEFTSAVNKNYGDLPFYGGNYLLPLNQLVLLEGLDFVPTNLLKNLLPDITSSAGISKLTTEQKTDLRFFLLIYSVAILHLIEKIVNSKSVGISDEKREAMRQRELKEELMVSEEDVPYLPDVTIKYGRPTDIRSGIVSMTAFRLLSGVFDYKLQLNSNNLEILKFNDSSGIHPELGQIVISAFAQIPNFKLGASKDLRYGIKTAAEFHRSKQQS
jgi:hypothetical protein